MKPKIDWKTVIRTYTGEEPYTVEAIEDPCVEGTHAVRAEFYAETHDYGSLIVRTFLLVTEHMNDGDQYGDYLEEVEFSSWPPPSKGAQ